jgi:transcriptional regulator with XRE-family HTH domain
MGVARGGRTPKLGKALAGYRRAHSLESVAIRLRKLGFVTASKSTLSKYEHGRPPDIGMLWGLATVYRVPFAALCEAVADELRSGTAGTPAPAISDEALAVATLYDAGPPGFRVLVDDAVALIQIPARIGSLSERVADRTPTTAGNPGQSRTVRAHARRKGA